MLVTLFAPALSFEIQVNAISRSANHRQGKQAIEQEKFTHFLQPFITTDYLDVFQVSA